MNGRGRGCGGWLLEKDVVNELFVIDTHPVGHAGLKAGPPQSAIDMKRIQVVLEEKFHFLHSQNQARFMPAELVLYLTFFTEKSN